MVGLPGAVRAPGILRPEGLCLAWSPRWADASDEGARLGELGGPACSPARAGSSTVLPGGSWGKLHKWGKLLGKRAGSGKRLEPRFSIPTCLTPSLLPWNQTTQRSSWRPGLGGPRLQLHSIKLEVTKGSKRGWKQKSSLHIRC